MDYLQEAKCGRVDARQRASCERGFRLIAETDARSVGDSRPSCTYRRTGIDHDIRYVLSCLNYWRIIASDLHLEPGFFTFSSTAS